MKINPLKAQERELWELWERLQKLRTMNIKGKIKCLPCGAVFNYPKVRLKAVVASAPLPFHFVVENNYFCCVDCDNAAGHQIAYKKRCARLGYEMRKKVRNHKQVSYDEYELLTAKKKLLRLLKNHDNEPIRK